MSVMLMCVHVFLMTLDQTHPKWVPACVCGVTKSINMERVGTWNVPSMVDTDGPVR